MSKKSKHGRGKHSHSRKRNKIHQMQPGAGVMPPVAGDISRATSAPPVSVAPAPQAPALVHKKSMASAALPLHYEFISGDLKRIGILTVIIIAILIVLFLFIK
jgi:hypothetical protein